MKSRMLTAGVALCALMSATHAHAQVMFNVRFGPTYATRTSTLAAYDSKGLVSMGGGGGFRLVHGPFSFDPLILIVGKGTKITNKTTGAEQRLKLQYIELPAIFTLTPMPSARLRPFIEAGPVLDLEMRCRFEDADANTVDSSGCDLQSNLTDDRHKVDLGLGLGGGFDYRMQEDRRLLLEFRYTHGFSNINDNDNSALVLRNRAYSVYLGYAFPLKMDM